MRHDPGLAASPHAWYMLRWRGQGWLDVTAFRIGAVAALIALDDARRRSSHTGSVRTLSVLAIGLAAVAVSGAGCGRATQTQDPDVTGAVGSSTPSDQGMMSGVVGAGGSSVGGSVGSSLASDAGRASEPAGAGGGSVPFEPEPLAAIPWAPPFTGRLAFAVTTQLHFDDGAGGGRTDYHRFTMLLDAETPLAILGVDGGGAAVTLMQTGTSTFYFADVVSIPTLQGRCPIGAFEYDDFHFTLTPTGELEGAGHGQNINVIGGVTSTFSAPMTLVGVNDTVGPILGLYPSSDLSDPLTHFTVRSSEPLPRPLLLRGAGGDVVELNPVPADVGILFEKPKVMLRYAETYAVDIDGLSDFAGNPPTVEGNISFGTREPPALLAEDGFESLEGESLLSNARVLSPMGAPIIAGARSLNLFPGSASGLLGTQFAVRLAIAPGDSVLRFSYQTVSTSATGGDDAEFLVTSPGGAIVSTVLPASGARTPARIYFEDVMLGPLTTATIELPADAAGEVVFMRAVANPLCEGPQPDPVGFIIDDLRVE